VAEPAELPRSSTQEQVSLEDTKPWWPLTAVQAWIVSRDPSTVVALCGPLSAVGKAAILLKSADRGGNVAARRELLNALGAEQVTAYGDRRDGSGLKAIPALEWSRLEYFYERGSDRAGPYHDVVIARAEAVRQWPGVPATLHGHKGNDVADQGRTQEAINQCPVPSRYSKSDLEKWWFKWLEHHKRAGTIPSRDEDWEAAKTAVSPHVSRDAVRRLRSDHAPGTWKKSGRRKADVKKTGDK
jgi:hypothetical protein